MSVSKNQRAGVRQKPRKRYCASQHEMTPVLMVPVFGRGRMVWRCECDGYTPISAEKKKGAA